jgi:Glycosyl transferase family 11
MIFVKLMGGLGNQMFQYAAARRLSLHRGTEVAFDLSYYDCCPEGDTPRTYELSRFAITAQIASSLEIAEISGVCRHKLQLLLVKIRSLLGLGRFPRNCYHESISGFDSQVLELPDNIYLHGYWHSANYFKDVESVIRSELTVNSEPTGRNKELLPEIASKQSVAIHFRRGDYVSNAKTAAYHGQLDSTYYSRALDIIVERIDSPHFYVFSDEPDWVKNNVTFRFPVTFIEHNSSGQAFEDMRLFSYCRHAIIANSSFSWWGAWLMQNSDKLVISPSRWFAKSVPEPNDLIPAGWIRI